MKNFTECALPAKAFSMLDYLLRRAPAAKAPAEKIGDTSTPRHSRACSWCGTRNEPDRQVCRACGLPVAREPNPTAPAPARPPRRHLGVVLAIVGSGIFLALVGIGVLLWSRMQNEKGAASRPRLAEHAFAMNAVIPTPQAVPAPALPETLKPAANPVRPEDQARRIPEVNARAKDLLLQGKFAEGLAAVEEILRQVESAELLETKVDLLHNSGKWNEAYATLLRLLKLRPEAAYLHYLAGTFALRLSGREKALPHFEAAAKLEPHNTSYQILLAKLYIQSGRMAQGTTLFQNLIVNDPQCMDCWYSFGDALFGAQQEAKAVAIFRVAIEQIPDNYLHYFNLALALDNWGSRLQDKAKLQEAAAHYRRSLELRPMPNSVAARRIFDLTGQQVPPALEAKQFDEVPLQFGGKVKIIQVRINGVAGRFVLDTGASYTAVFREVAERYKLSATSRLMESSTANGVIQTPVAYARVEVGRQKLERAVVLLLPDRKGNDGTDGLLSMDFLEKFDWQIPQGQYRLIFRGYSNKNQGL
jgi:tetratricopeptide (TPR) repeat protein